MIKATGVIWSLVLALAPVVLDWLPQAQAAGWLTPTVMAIVVVVINGVVKVAQMGIGEPTALSRSIPPQRSRLHQLFFG